MNIGMNIKKIREEKKISMSYLADKLKISKSTISRYESGKREPNLETLNKIAKALGVPIEELLSTPNIKPYKSLSDYTTRELLEELARRMDK